MDENEKEQLIAENEALREEIAQYTPTEVQKGLAIVCRLREAPYIVQRDDLKSLFAFTDLAYKCDSICN